MAKLRARACACAPRSHNVLFATVARNMCVPLSAAESIGIDRVCKKIINAAPVRVLSSPLTQAQQ